MTFQCYLGPATPASPDSPGTWIENTPGHWCVPVGQDFLLFEPANKICCLEGAFDTNLASQTGSYELAMSFVDQANVVHDLNFGTYQLFIAAFGTDHPAVGASQTVNVGGIGVSLTVLGPSVDLQIGGQTGAFLYRIDNDSLPAGFRICFDQPVNSLRIDNTASVAGEGICPVGLQDFAVKQAVDILPPNERTGCC